MFCDKYRQGGVFMEGLIYIVIVAVVLALNVTSKGKKQAKERQAGGYGASTH